MDDRLKDINIQSLLKKVTDKNTKHLNDIKTLEKGFEGATDGFWVWYISEDYEYMSPKFKAALGYTDEDFPNHPSMWQKLIFPEDLEIANKNFEEYVATKGEHKYHQVVNYYCKDGSVKKFICRGEVIKWDGDKPVVMVGSHIDLTNIAGL